MITAIVPARSGSKRLPGKNIKHLNGRPLVFHTLDAFVEHDQISTIIFTSDSLEYINMVNEEFGNKVDCVHRPIEYGGDHVKVYDEVKRLINNGAISTDWYLLGLPTCPMRNHIIVENMLSQWDVDQRPVFSAVEYDFPTQFAFQLSGNSKSWNALNENSPMLTGNTRSQDIPKTYRPNGAMYLQKLSNIENNTFYINADVYLMDLIDSVDVDTELDFLICEHIMHSKEVVI
jgi:CMP-N,N'-diacetyllegionaminic acid synthase